MKTKIFHIKFRILIKLIRFIHIGTQPLSEEDINDKIKIFNILNLISIISLFLIITLFYLTNLFTHVIFSCLLIPPLLLVYFFHYIKKYVLAKFFCFQLYNGYIACAFLYSSQSILSYYHVPIIIAATLIFHYKEWKYLVLVTLTSFSLLFIETNTFLLTQANNSGFLAREYLDNYLLVVLVFYILTLVYFYMSYTKLKSDRLITISDKLVKSKIELGKQSQDLIAFSKASTHFIKSPVYISNFFAEKIEKGILENKNYAELEKYFDLIQSSIDNEEIFINNMFDYNEIITIKTKKEKVDLYVLLLQSIFEYKKNRHIEFYIEPFKSSIRADKNLLKKAFFVLFENANNYNLSGSPHLHISAECDGENIILNFKDNGIGIDHNFSDKIFEPFLRINDLSNINGAGLGLAKAAKIAEILNGNLNLKDSSEKGSTFQLSLKTTN